MKQKNNVGIVGYWYATNYGSVITYYALYKVIEKMGYQPMLIDRPEADLDPEGLDVISRQFMNVHCRISPSVSWNQLKDLNTQCDSFVVGSDQVWTGDAMRHMKGMFFLNFVEDSKRKIAYAPSFGYDRVVMNTEELNEASRLLHRFQAISVREDSGRTILAEKFQINAEQKLDPVFLLEREAYHQLAEESSWKRENYILAYILDPSEEKERVLKRIEESLGKSVCIVLDARKNTFETNIAKLKMYGRESVEPGVKIEDWVRMFRDASYVFTDSHHGVAMAMIFQKQFLCFANYGRGYTRFSSLLGMFGLMGRMIRTWDEMNDTMLHREIDYAVVESLLREKSVESQRWLKDSLEMDLTQKRYQRTWSSDFERCRTVVSMVRQYGIRHVVLSSGTRNLTLARFFENNACFQTHMVIDERSAAFYGLGLALELQEPVAICCTSGTAASNYLSAVTEAYYQGVPLAVITADRYPCFMNNLEDQTIPQTAIFQEVCKKIVTLPVSQDRLSIWETRRLIAEALLEMTHHGNGPVQINVPLQEIQRKPPARNLFWLWNYRHIERMDNETEEGIWRGKMEELFSKKRILIIYGQNSQLRETDLNILREFVEKFQCVLLKDQLSNLPVSDGILSYPIVKHVAQDLFDRELAPEMVISLYGKRMLNDPVTFRLRGTKDFVHWRVCGDGMPADPYQKLSVVFECGETNFMRHMLNLAGARSKQPGGYAEQWEKQQERVRGWEQTETWQMKYVIQRAMESLPAHSLLHIAIGNTVMYTGCYPLQRDVKVFCNMGTNGIDGCMSTYMGHVAVTDRLAFLFIGDCSFFYDMNALFNKRLKDNIRILLINNNGAGLLRDHESRSITQEHGYYSAKAYAESLGFCYMRADDIESYREAQEIFFSADTGKPVFLEVFCE